MSKIIKFLFLTKYKSISYYTIKKYFSEMDAVAYAFNFSIQEKLEHENHHGLKPSLD